MEQVQPQIDRVANVRFGSKADIAAPPTNVRFAPERGHWNSTVKCLLCAKSGLMHRNIRAVTFAIGWNAFGACSCIITGVKIGPSKIKACCKSFGHWRSRAKAADNISCEAAGGT